MCDETFAPNVFAKTACVESVVLRYVVCFVRLCVAFVFCVVWYYCTSTTCRVGMARDKLTALCSAPGPPKTLAKYTAQQLLKELTNLREHECATMYTISGVNRLLARLRKWNVDIYADIKEQENKDAALMSSKKSKSVKEGLLKDSSRYMGILKDDLIEVDLKSGWLSSALELLSEGNAAPTDPGPEGSSFGSGFGSVATTKVPSSQDIDQESTEVDQESTEEGPAGKGPNEGDEDDDGATKEGDDGATEEGPAGKGTTDAGTTDEGDDSSGEDSTELESEEEKPAPKKTTPKKAAPNCKKKAKPAPKKAENAAAVAKKLKPLPATKLKKAKNLQLQEAQDEALAESIARQQEMIRLSQSPALLVPSEHDTVVQPLVEDDAGRRAKWLASVKLKHKISGDWYGSTASVPCKAIQGGHLTGIIL
jgi:hypothetical protein